MRNMGRSTIKSTCSVQSELCVYLSRRCALQSTGRRLGGYFVKFGQMISTLDQGIPVEWIETMINCQVIAYLLLYLPPGQSNASSLLLHGQSD